jgi:hypothetical protein
MTSTKTSKYSDSASQTEKYANQPTFFEDDPRKMTAAMLHNTRRTMRPRFFEWLQVVEVKLKTKRRQQVTLRRWAQHSAYICLKAWMEILLEQKDFKRKAGKVIRMLTNTGLVSSMEQWKHAVKTAKSSKHILSKVICNMQRLFARKAFQGWLFKVDLAIARKQLLTKVAEIWWSNLLKKYFDVWLETSKTETENRQRIATENVPPPWKPARHIFTLDISATIHNLVSDGIGQVGFTFCGSDTTSEIVYLNFEGARTACGTVSSYTHLGKIASIVLEPARQDLRFSRIDVCDQTLGLTYLFIENAQQVMPESATSKAASKWRKKITSSSELGESVHPGTDFGKLKRKFLPSGEPSSVANPKLPPVVKKLSYAFETPIQLRTKIQVIEKWLHRGVIDIKLLHRALSTNVKVVDVYLEYSTSDAASIAPAMSKIHAYCKSHISRVLFVKGWKAARTLTFLSLVALQRRRFQFQCLQLNFLWSRICSHHIRAQYIESWESAFTLMIYLRVRSTPIVLARHQHAANVLLRGLKRFRSIMHYRKWLTWKSCLRGAISAMLPRRKYKSAMHLKRLCWAKFGALRRKFQRVQSAALFVTRRIKADSASFRIQRMYLHGLACVRLIQSTIRVHFQKKVRAKVARLLHEREQHAFKELQKMEELKNLLEQCHSPESAAYWRKYGTTEIPGDIKPMKLSWASIQSIVHKTGMSGITSLGDASRDEKETSNETPLGNSLNPIATGCDSGTADVSRSFDGEPLNASQVHGHPEAPYQQVGLSPFLRRFEDANQRVAEYRQQGYQEMLNAQRFARGIHSGLLVHEMKLRPTSALSREGVVRSGSDELGLPEIRATFRKLRSVESVEKTIWAPPVKGMVVPRVNVNVEVAKKHVPNPPSALVRNAQAFMSVRSKKLAQKTSDSS